MYLRTRGYFEAFVPGGFAGLLSSIEADELRVFMAQPFATLRWYDALPIPDLVMAEASRLQLSPDVYLKRRAAWQATEDLKTLYSAILRLATPERVALRLPGLLGEIVDFGQATIVRETARCVRADFATLPEPLSPWFEHAIAAYAERAMQLAGAREARADVSVPTGAGERNGVSLVARSIRLEWT